MNMKHLLLSVVMLANFAACGSPEDSTIDPPPELITHVLLTLKDSANMQDSVVARFEDLDGPTGSAQPVITGVTLKGGHTYLGTIRFLEVRRDLTDSVIDVTNEVRELATQHQIFYTPDNSLQPAVSAEVTDKDANSMPLGLAMTIRTQAVSTTIVGKLNVVLSHYEQLGTKNGTDRSDETDVSVDFPLTISQ
jgi:hypothetical protein